MSAFKAFPPPPTVKPHQHTLGTCPVTGNSHAFCPAQEGDIRSPCPALNALANHGYLPRDGKRINVSKFVAALRKGYGLNIPLSVFLTLGTFVLLKKRPQTIDLDRVAEHNKIEHDASLVHQDTKHGETLAPHHVDEEMLKQCMEWFTTPDDDENRTEGGNQVIGVEDVARARVHREKRSPPLDATHAEIARGEMAIALLVFETPASLSRGAPVGIPKEWLREWLGIERMPKGGSWRPSKRVGLIATVKKAKQIRLAMAAIRSRLGEEARPGILWEKGITNGGNRPAGSPAAGVPTESSPAEGSSAALVEDKADKGKKEIEKKGKGWSFFKTKYGEASTSAGNVPAEGAPATPKKDVLAEGAPATPTKDVPAGGSSPAPADDKADKGENKTESKVKGESPIKTKDDDASTSPGPSS